LLGIFRFAQVGQRLPAATTNTRFGPQINPLLTHRKMGIISASRAGAIGLLAAFLFVRRAWILGIIQVIRAVGRRLFLRLPAELIRLQLANLRPGLIKFLAQLLIALDCIRVPTLPIARFASQLRHLTTQLRNLRSHLRHESKQISVSVSGRFLERGIHDATQ
jgi:hypothetical protein